MLYFVETEREQCQGNKVQVQDFNKTNACGDEYSRINTVQVTDNLSKAEATLDTMELALYAAIAAVILESMGTCCYIFCCKSRWLFTH